jgi:hypothetical protein
MLAPPVSTSFERLAAYQRRATLPVAIATVCVVPALLLETSPDPAWIVAAQILNWASWLVLAAHVAVMLAIGGLAGLRLAWLDAILVVVSIPVASTSLGAARLLRLVRVLRLGVALSATVRHARAILQHRQFHSWRWSRWSRSASVASASTRSRAARTRTSSRSATACGGRS